MSVVQDGLYQFGGMPVGFDFWTSKVFATPSGTRKRGRAWFVDPSYGGNGNGRTPSKAMSTMDAAFDKLASGDIIYFMGKVVEQLVTPVQIFDVTVVGCGNRPRHADATPAGGNWAASQWGPPASGGVAAQATIRVLQQGWRFINILFTAIDANAAMIELVRNAAAGDAERDASHAEILGCRITGAGKGVKFGATSFTEIVNNAKIQGNDFYGCSTAIANHSVDLAYRAQITDNVFSGNTNDIVLGGYEEIILRNTMSLAPTACIVLSGGTGSSRVHGNFLPGTYANGALYAPGSNDNWNGNFASTGVTAANPA